MVPAGTSAPGSGTTARTRTARSWPTASPPGWPRPGSPPGKSRSQRPIWAGSRWLSRLPVAPHLDEKRLLAILENKAAPVRERAEAAGELVWLRRCRAHDTIDVGCLRLGRSRILHLPGELFVEYQLAAQQLRPDLFVALAAYGDYAPGYIGTEVAYPQGGYETGPRASLVAPSGRWMSSALLG